MEVLGITRSQKPIQSSLVKKSLNMFEVYTDHVSRYTCIVRKLIQLNSILQCLPTLPTNPKSENIQAQYGVLSFLSLASFFRLVLLYSCMINSLVL